MGTTAGEGGRLVRAVAAVLAVMLGAAAAVAAPVSLPRAATAATPVTTPPAPDATAPPKSAVQTGAGRVRISGPTTRGATRLRLVEDGVVVVETSARVSSTKVFDRSGVATGSHTYAFQAGNAGGWGPVSSSVSVTVVDAPSAAAAPTLSQTSDTSMSASWSAVPGATAYIVSVNGTPAGTVQPRPGVDPVVKKLTRLTMGSSYSVTVTATNVAGRAPASPSSSLTLHGMMKRVAPPSTGEGTVQTGAGAVRVVSRTTPGAASYTLLVDGSPSGATPSVVGERVTFDVTGLSAGDHTFAVRTTNPARTATSSPLTLKVLGAPSASGSLSVQQTSDTTARLTFVPGTDATSARVHLDGALVAEPRIGRGVTSVSVTLPAMTALSSHSVTVTSVNVVGASAASAALPFTLYPALTATSGQPTASQTGEGAVRVVIGTTPNATTYSLLQDGVSVLDATASAGSVRFDVTGLEPNRRYVYEVVAKNPRNSAAKSRFVSVLVVPVLDSAPDVTAGHAYRPGLVDVTLSLAPTPGADGYRVYVDGVANTTRYEPLTLVAGRASIVVSLDSSVDHDVEVRAFNRMGDSPASAPYTAPADPG